MTMQSCHELENGTYQTMLMGLSLLTHARAIEGDAAHSAAGLYI